MSLWGSMDNNAREVHASRPDEAATESRLCIGGFTNPDSMFHASRPDEAATESRLCIGGFTNPDSMFWIMRSMYTNGDGLLDCFLFWMLPGRVYLSRSVDFMFHTKICYSFFCQFIYSLLSSFHLLISSYLPLFLLFFVQSTSKLKIGK